MLPLWRVLHHHTAIEPQGLVRGESAVINQQKHAAGIAAMPMGGQS